MALVTHIEAHLVRVGVRVEVETGVRLGLGLEGLDLGLGLGPYWSKAYRLEHRSLPIASESSVHHLVGVRAQPPAVEPLDDRELRHG